jgi:hypothetical protein
MQGVMSGISQTSLNFLRGNRKTNITIGLLTYLSQWRNVSPALGLPVSEQGLSQNQLQAFQPTCVFIATMLAIV